MTEWTSIAVTRQQKQELREAKPDHMSMGAWIVQELCNRDPQPDVAELLDDLKNEISMTEDPVVQVDTERLLGRLDELEAQIPNKTASELEERLR